MRQGVFMVRLIASEYGTAAKVRVIIKSQDHQDIWDTVGVPGNIIQAS